MWPVPPLGQKEARKQVWRVMGWGRSRGSALRGSLGRPGLRLSDGPLFPRQDAAKSHAVCSLNGVRQEQPGCLARPQHPCGNHALGGEFRVKGTNGSASATRDHHRNPRSAVQMPLSLRHCTEAGLPGSFLG